MHGRRVYEVCTVALWLLGCTAMCILACLPVCVCVAPARLRNNFCWLWVFLQLKWLLLFLTFTHTQICFALWQWHSLCCHKEAPNCSIKRHEGARSLLHIYSGLAPVTATLGDVLKLCHAQIDIFQLTISQCSSNPFPQVIIQRHCQNAAHIYHSWAGKMLSRKSQICTSAYSRSW